MCGIIIHTQPITKGFYASNDLIVTISKVTNDIVKNVTPYVDCVHHTHAVNTEVFKKFDDDEIDLARMTHMPDIGDKFLFSGTTEMQEENNLDL